MNCTERSELIVTGRNEVVAKVMFLQVCVCPQGGGCLPQCMLGCQPPRPGTPPDQADAPRTRQTPPRTRQTPLTRQTPPDQADPPGPGRPTPRDQADPPGKQTPAYGLREAGMHPTGMHSCSQFFSLKISTTSMTFVIMKS